MNQILMWGSGEAVHHMRLGRIIGGSMRLGARVLPEGRYRCNEEVETAP